VSSHERGLPQSLHHRALRGRSSSLSQSNLESSRCILRRQARFSRRTILSAHRSCSSRRIRNCKFQNVTVWPSGLSSFNVIYFTIFLRCNCRGQVQLYSLLQRVIIVFHVLSKLYTVNYTHSYLLRSFQH